MWLIRVGWCLGIFVVSIFLQPRGNPVARIFGIVLIILLSLFGAFHGCSNPVVHGPWGTTTEFLVMNELDVTVAVVFNSECRVPELPYKFVIHPSSQVIIAGTSGAVLPSTKFESLTVVDIETGTVIERQCQIYDEKWQKVTYGDGVAENGTTIHYTYTIKVEAALLKMK